MRVAVLIALPPEHDVGPSPEVDKVRRFLEVANPTINAHFFNVAQHDFPEQAEAFDAYLITGSTASVFEDEPWIHTLTGFTQQAYAEGKKMMGICFGHQMLAHALGGEVQRSDHGWMLGAEPFELRSQKPWMQPEISTENHYLYYMNQDIVTKLPPDAELLGSSERCEFASFSIGDRVFSMQPHPEQPGEFVDEVVTILQDYLPSETIERARNSIQEKPVYGDQLSNWFTNFLTYED